MQLFPILVFVSAVSAITIRQAPPPQCSISCLTNTNTHGCSNTDNSCLCRNSQFIADQSACIFQACTNPSDLQQAITFAQQTCLTVGVTLTSSVASATRTATSSSGISSTTSSTSSAPSSSTSSSGASSLVITTPGVFLVGVAAIALAL